LLNAIRCIAGRERNGSSRQLAHVLAFGAVLCAAAGSSFAMDLAGTVTCPQNASCVASTSMGALAPDIFYYRVMDKRSFPRGRIVLCTRAHSVQSGVGALGFGFSAERFPN
jgi:hypothetical protein